jgi:uncharacterized protein (UPF0548 family)
MILLRRPSDEAVRTFLDEQRDAPFSYPEVGATRLAAPPQGYAVDHTRVRLGTGEAAYAAAVDAVRSWTMFRIGWAEICWPDTPVAVGAAVAVLARFGPWWLNATRIVYVFDDEGPTRRFGFAYGTLDAHVERGEERFGVEWNVSDGSVWYDVLAFSKPNHLLTRAGYPVARRLQKRFARDSARAMVDGVTRSARTP